MRSKSFPAVAACATVLAGLSAGPAFAGEITGNGKPVIAPSVAHSECSFSGKNDNPGAPLDNPDAGGVSQSYGQLVRLGVIETFFEATPKTFNPGDSCRGNLPG